MDFDKAVPARGSKNRSDRNFNRARKERFRIAYNFDIRRYPRVFRPRPRRSNRHKQLLFCTGQLQCRFAYRRVNTVVSIVLRAESNVK